uniref:Uncharacterized protein n=1 Tax=Anopheles atroparvus TaxID=41427 RepID=A0AAG5DCC2_ANOAO
DDTQRSLSDSFLLLPVKFISLPCVGFTFSVLYFLLTYRKCSQKRRFRRDLIVSQLARFSQFRVQLLKYRRHEGTLGVQATARRQIRNVLAGELLQQLPVLDLLHFGQDRFDALAQVRLDRFLAPLGLLGRGGCARERDDDDAHVVPAALVQAGVDHLVRHLDQVVRQLEAAVYELAQLRVAHHVPHAVAREHQKLVRRLPVAAEDLRLGRNELLALPERRHVLVVVVAERAAHRQTAVHPLHHHRTARVLNALLLARQDRLVVLRGEHGLPVLAEDGPRVATVRHVQVLAGDERTDGRRARFVHAGLQLRDVAHRRVQLQEAGVDAARDVIVAELGRADDALEQIAGAVLRHVVACVPIEHGEVVPVLQPLAQARLGVVRVLHLAPPALHRANAEAESIALAVLVVFGRHWLLQKGTHRPAGFLFLLCAAMIPVGVLFSYDERRKKS